MKLTKTLLCTAVAGAMAIAAGKVSAALGPITISGTASAQDYNSKDYAIIKPHGFNQKDILQLLAIATGDSSITNKPTKLLYNPDAVDWAWYYSNQGSGSYHYGVFYYTNSTAGLVALSDYDGGGNYYSYIELDSYVGYDNMWGVLGFGSADTTEYNYVYKEGNNSGSFLGNAVLYIHSSPYDYNLPANHYYANNYDGYYNQYALVIHGTLQASGSQTSTTLKENFQLQGSGDGVWYTSDTGHMPLVIKGKASFSGKGTVLTLE